MSLKIDDVHFVESIDTGSIFSVDEKTFTKFSDGDIEVFSYLLKNKIVKDYATNDSCFSAMIIVNSDCNLNCPYCFEKGHFLNNGLSLTENVQTYIVSNLKCDNDITFTGGEPLLAIDKIRKIVGIISSKKFNCRYSLITNGVLLNSADYSFFDKYHFSLQISLDGDKANNVDSNDRKNIRIENRILNNIYRFLTNTINTLIEIRINYSKSNVHDFELKVDYIKNRLQDFLDSGRVTLSLELVDLYADEKEWLSFKEKSKYYKEFYRYLFKSNISVPSRFVLGGKCMARDNGTVLLDPYGNIYPCYSFVGDKRYSCGNINNKIKRTKFLYPVCDEKCDIAEICYGGCLYENYCDCGEIRNVCNYAVLNELNKLLFILNLCKLKNYRFQNIERELANVENISIDFKQAEH